MKVLFKNEINKFISKKSNVMILGVLVAAIIFAGHSMTSKASLIKLVGVILPQFNGAIAFILGLLINFVLYSVVKTKNVLNRQQAYLLDINIKLVPVVFIFVIFVLNLILAAYPIYLIVGQLKGMDYFYILFGLFVSNMIMFLFTRNAIGLLSAVALLVYARFSFITSVGYIVVASLAFILSAIQIIFEEKLSLENKFALNLGYFTRNRFSESILYMYRKEKIVKWIWLMVALIAYPSLPESFKFHYHNGIVTDTIIYQIILFVVLIVWLVKSFIFTRVENLYVKTLNSKAYFSYLLFNTLIAVGLFGLSSVLDHRTDMVKMVTSFNSNVIMLVIMAAISVIIRKRNFMISIIAVIAIILLPDMVIPKPLLKTTLLTISIVGGLVILLAWEFIQGNKSSFELK